MSTRPQPAARRGRDLSRYATQSRFSDPREYAHLLADLPADVDALTAVVRNTIAHYRSPGVEFTPEHLAEVDNRWVDRILASDQARFRRPLDVARPYEQHVAGCCRDFTLLTVAALRQHGIPARSRIGFAGYFFPDGYHADHVIVEYWNGQRWVWTDAELDPAQDWGFDITDMPRTVGAKATPGPFVTAAQVWTAYRRGAVDDRSYGVAPGLPIGGAWFIRNYVISELAHRQCDELLLWDGWGAMSSHVDGDLDLIDDVAGLLLAADDGDESAEAELARRYAETIGCTRARWSCATRRPAASAGWT